MKQIIFNLFNHNNLPKSWFRLFTNKKFNPQIIQHPTTPIHPINPSSDK